MLACYGDKKIGGPGLTVEINESMFGGYADNFGICTTNWTILDQTDFYQEDVFS